jgi:PAS domain S-box-containing protein
MARTLLAARGSLDRMKPLVDESRHRRYIALAIGSFLFALVTLLRFQVDGLETPVAMLYVFPIAAIALEFEVIGGVVAGFVSSVSFLAWVEVAGEAFTAPIWMRVVILIGIGAVVGWVSRERHLEGAIARAVIDSMPEPASVKDLHGRYLLTNPALERMLQRSGQEIVGANRPVGQSPELEAVVSEADRRVIETGEAVELELPANVPELGTTVMQTVKAPVKDDAGHVVAIVTLAHDISARVEYERELLRMSEAARDEYERARTDYERLMRHRIANPLTILTGAAEALRLPYAEAAAHREEIAQLIADQVHRLERLDTGATHIAPEEHELEARANADLEALRQRVALHAESIRTMLSRRNGGR